jgi:hypothetical protein
MKNEKKQTAVEWFFDQLTEVDYNCINKTFLQSDKTLAGYKLRELLQQAKEMERQQIKSAYFQGWGSEMKTSEQYYEQTYGGGEK